MGLFRRIAGMFGLGGRDEGGGEDGDAEGDSCSSHHPEDGKHSAAQQPQVAGVRKGFKVPIVVERDAPGPVLVHCADGDGGVQGFRWYTRRLRMDEDGDVADEFLEEVIPEPSVSSNSAIPAARFRAKYNTTPTAMLARKQTIAVDGDIRQSLEYQGQLRWV